VTDSRAIVSRALKSRRVVVVGANFIGLELAASLRARNIDVHVVGRETTPMERILGPDVGKFISKLT
jgi:apoptosis-inducing factor 3